MLDRVDFPLTNSQISQFVLDKGYTNYFNLQEAINQLLEGGFMASTMIRNTSHYQPTEEGREALALFENMLPYAIKQDILKYFDQEKINLRNEVEILADYYPAEKGEFTVACTIKERSDTLLDIKMNVPSREQAISICDCWQDKSAEVYNFLIKHLWSS